MSRPFGLCRVFLLLCAIAVCWGAHVPAAAADARPGVYLALGDSLAAGFGANPAGDAYVPRVFAYLRAAGRPRVERVVNLGISGETTSSFLAGQLGQALQAINDPSTDVRYVTLDIGANDILFNPQCFASPLSCPIEANLTTILTALTGALAHEPQISGSRG
jgi:lysophospholipase L1-like esterase